MKSYRWGSPLCIVLGMTVFVSSPSGSSTRQQTPAAYQLQFTFSGAHIQLELKDSASWAPPGSLTAAFVNAGAPIRSYMTVHGGVVTFNAEDNKTPTSGGLTISVLSSADTVTFDVFNDGVVGGVGPTGLDNFVDQTKGGKTYTLKLR